jgi:hypothetical protein
MPSRIPHRILYKEDTQNLIQYCTVGTGFRAHHCKLSCPFSQHPATAFVQWLQIWKFRDKTRALHYSTTDRLCNGHLLQTSAVNTAWEPGDTININRPSENVSGPWLTEEGRGVTHGAANWLKGRNKSSCSYKSQNDDDVSPTHTQHRLLSRYQCDPPNW